MAGRSDEEAALLARLQAQFGDIDMSEVINRGGGGGGEDDGSSGGGSSSSAAEPTPEELAAWLSALKAGAAYALTLNLNEGQASASGAAPASSAVREAARERELGRVGAGGVRL